MKSSYNYLTKQPIDQEIEIMARFMGYTYHQYNVYQGLPEDGDPSYINVFSKVPILVNIDEYGTKEFQYVDNPDYGKTVGQKFINTFKLLSWGTVNFPNYIVNPEYKTDWNVLHEVLDKIMEIYNQADEELFSLIKKENPMILELSLCGPDIEGAFKEALNFILFYQKIF